MNEEMERDSLSTFSHFLFISPLSIHFLYQKLSHLYSTFVANVTKKTYHTGYEKIILGRIRCEKAPQVVPACTIQRQYMAWKTFVVVVPVEVLFWGEGTFTFARFSWISYISIFNICNQAKS